MLIVIHGLLGVHSWLKASQTAQTQLILPKGTRPCCKTSVFTLALAMEASENQSCNQLILLVAARMMGMPSWSCRYFSKTLQPQVSSVAVHASRRCSRILSRWRQQHHPLMTMTTTTATTRTRATTTATTITTTTTTTRKRQQPTAGFLPHLATANFVQVFFHGCRALGSTMPASKGTNMAATMRYFGESKQLGRCKWKG